MSAIAISSLNQGFSRTSINPSGAKGALAHLTRRGRLARFLMVLSLAIVMVAGFAMKAGAGTPASAQISAAGSYVQVLVASGDTLWSLATRLSDGGDVRAFVDEIIVTNSLATADLTAGQKLRIPLK